MESLQLYVIKSFKHDGHLHRSWLKNWRIPDNLLAEDDAAESMLVLVNHQTPVRESNGEEWISKIPAVAFFIPGMWYNIVALIEESGIRYYCNIASPPYVCGRVLTYIDYDLDVIVAGDGGIQIVDWEEYELHKSDYRYPDVVQRQVKAGLDALLARIYERRPPFHDERVMAYYDFWANRMPEV